MFSCTTLQQLFNSIKSMQNRLFTVNVYVYQRCRVLDQYVCVCVLVPVLLLLFFIVLFRLVSIPEVLHVRQVSMETLWGLLHRVFTGSMSFYRTSLVLKAQNGKNAATNGLLKLAVTVP